MTVRKLHVGLVLLLMLVAASCAKRPVTTQVSAPAPTGVGAPVAPEAARPTPAVPPTAAAPAPTAPATPLAPTAPAPTPRPAPEEYVAIPQLRDAFFDFDKYDIRPDAARTLDANIDWLKSNASALVLIEGHCDERGTNAYNIALGERRARATRDYLVSRGVTVERITTISYGEERPVCTDRNETCWARNRRAHFLTRSR
jgi:peptidoglycan-associated lipoprotein